MNAKRFSHAACLHPSTKVARAACRRAMKKATIASVVSTAFEIVPKSPIITAWDAMKSGPLELTAAPIVPAVEVTRENWRDHKSDTVRVMIADDAETVLDGMITGWSVKLLQLKTAEKTLRVPADSVAYAAVING